MKTNVNATSLTESAKKVLNVILALSQDELSSMITYVDLDYPQDHKDAIIKADIAMEREGYYHDWYRFPGEF